MRETKEFVSRFRIVAERTEERARDGLRVLFLDAPHHHAKVLRFNNDADSTRLEHVHERIRNLLSQPFLDL